MLISENNEKQDSWNVYLVKYKPTTSFRVLVKSQENSTTRQGSCQVHELSPKPMSFLLLSTWILRLFLLYDFWLYSSSAWEYLIAVPVPFGLCLGSESPFFGLWMDFLIKSMGVERMVYEFKPFLNFLIMKFNRLVITGLAMWEARLGMCIFGES